MVTRRHLVALAVLVATVAGCAGPTGSDPIAERPYLVAVDPLDQDPDGTVTGTLTVERDCLLLDTDDGLVLPLFSATTRFGPLDGGATTIDVEQVRLRVGDEVSFDGETGQVTEGLRSQYPGVDLTRCGVRRYALLGEVAS